MSVLWTVWPCCFRLSACRTGHGPTRSRGRRPARSWFACWGRCRNGAEAGLFGVGCSDGWIMLLPGAAAGHRRWGRVVDRASVKPNGSGCRIGMWVKSSAAWRRCGGLTGRDALRAAPARSAGRCSGGAAGCVGCRSGGAPAQRCTRRSCRPAPGCAQRAWRGPTGRRSRQRWAVRLPQRDASPR